MANINTVTVVGNVTRDPELRETTGGKNVLELGVAVNRRYPDPRNQGEWLEKTSFIDVVCWQQLAENVAASVEKGTRVIVTGRLEQDRWENEEGEKRSKHRLVADLVAPSLEWATAEVTKNPKANGGGGNDGAPPVEDEDF